MLQISIKALVDLFFEHLLQLNTMNGYFLLQVLEVQFYTILHSSSGFPLI